MPLFSAHLCVSFTTFISFDCCILCLCFLHQLPNLGSDEWYLDEIKEEYSDPDEKGYEKEDVGEYICKVLRGYAEADYEFLGKHLPGAPDEIQPGTEVEPGYIPTRLQYKPDWLDLNPRVVSYKAVPLAQELPALGYSGPFQQ